MVRNRLVNVRDMDIIMENDFVFKLQEMTNDGILTCAQICKFAKKNNIDGPVKSPCL
jgi:hypothetical protein